MPYRSSATSFGDTPWQYDATNFILKTTYSAIDQGIYMDFGNGIFELKDSSPQTSIDWQNRTTNDTGAVVSIEYGKRNLNDEQGIPVFNWSLGWKTQASVYNLWEKDLNIQGVFGDFNNYGFQYEGDVIQVEVYQGTLPSRYNIVSLRTDGTWEDANQTTASATKMLGVLIDTDNTYGIVLLEGHLQVQSTTAGDAPYVNGVDQGLPIYLEDATTTGRMNTTVPTSRYVRLLGYAYLNTGQGDIWLMRFDPDMSWVEI
jgi:hypothetical protein